MATSAPADDRAQLIDSATALHSLVSTFAIEWPGLDSGTRTAFTTIVQDAIASLETLERQAMPLKRRSTIDPLGGLTNREFEVLLALAEGGTTSRIAAELGIGEGTVRSHIKNVLWKLGAHTRVEAIARLVHPRIPHVDGPD